MLVPQFFNSCVRVVPISDGRAEVAEERVGLGGGALVARNGKRGADVSRQRVSRWIGDSCDRKTKAPQIMVLIVVAVPAAVVLDQVDFELDSLWERNRLFGRKHGLARPVPASGTDIDAPCRFVFAIDCKFNRTGDAIL